MKVDIKKHGEECFSNGKFYESCGVITDRLCKETKMGFQKPLATQSRRF